jgi:hypothetical protein
MVGLRTIDKKGAEQGKNTGRLNILLFLLVENGESEIFTLEDQIFCFFFFFLHYPG